MENNHTESHEKNTGWLRAGVLGANDGLLSTAGLLSGVIAGQANHDQILLAGVAALLSGALSMAAGEYVSVSSQRDSQKAQLRQEAHEIKQNPEQEQLELCRIYMDRGLDEALARQVSFQLMQRDPLEAHAREELGLTEVAEARPVQAALASAVSFVSGAVPPVLIGAFVPHAYALPMLFVSTLILLVILGVISAKLGGSNPLKGALRILFWGTVALAFTALIGHLLGQAIG
ncbi:VIT family protein [Acidithiobacillus thiooxidans]|uniref:VIT1/CCC1 transporter family protein n=1 Tax=Acidithiobacillus thiooxidans TaxID=930 RepID=UPI001C06EE1B|nr:VIT family protein [Acidithiobacillus thiooxidans]MBU2752175.1 VIT family protein [Acidithiobacillus thiooxidans]MBU2794074.1 VIT family protein [Acidithiobacillus thiooxidans]